MVDPLRFALKPAASAMRATSSREYLWLFSVQMVSPSSNATVRSAARIVTVWRRSDCRCISMLRFRELNRATCRNWPRSKSRIQLAIDAGQKIQIERGRDSQRIVVGIDELRNGFFQIRPQQQSIAGLAESSECRAESL